MFLFTNSFVHYIKDWIARPRPYFVLKDTYLLGHVSGGSMPSGHAATYGLIGLFMILYIKRYRMFWIGFVIFEGFCRVYQGVHYPSDVLASWFIAISVMCLFSILYKLFQKERQGYVEN
jgi:undecaprenyl-diphosphatase